MASVNKVILIGNLGADPEVKFTPAGHPVCNMRLATNERWTDKSGETQERTEWHAVTVWGKQAETCGQHLRKGRSVYVEGRLQSREYTDKDGIERRVWDVVATAVTFLGSPGDADRAPAGGRAAGGGWGAATGQAKAAPARQGWGAPTADDEPEMPF